mgnify:CR=1 FL=1
MIITPPCRLTMKRRISDDGLPDPTGTPQNRGARCGKEDVSIGRMRLMGYLRALREQGIEPDEGLICYMNPKLPSYSMENGYV